MNKIYNNLNADNLVNTEMFNQFDELQKEQIALGIKNNIDVFVYAKPEFGWQQMKEIRLGLENNIDVSIYAKSEFDSGQMIEIRLGLEYNLNVSVYAKTEFKSQQMREIRWGLEAKINISVYAKSELNWEQMNKIRVGLEKGLDYDKEEFNEHQITQMFSEEDKKKMMLQGLSELQDFTNMLSYSKKDFNEENM